MNNTAKTGNGIKALAVSLLTLTLLTVLLLTVNASGETVSGAIAPGGSVKSNADFITALGGEGNAAVSGDGATIYLSSDIILTAPIMIESGSYRIIGRGCTIYRGFSDGALFQLNGINLTDKEGNAITLPSLTLGAEIKTENQNLDDPDLVLNGNSEGFKEAVNGPLVAILGKCTVTVNPSTKLINNRSAVPGGAIYMESFPLGDETTPLDPTLKITGGEISGNSSEIEGGAIAAYGRVKGSASGSILITECKIEGNSAVSTDEKVYGRGGAIFSNGVALTLNACALEANTADLGGALHVNHIAMLTQTNLTQNKANVSGGAIYADVLINELDQASAPANVTLSSVFMSENRSEGSGGAIVNKGIFIFDKENSSYVSQNTANGDGAVIYNEGTLELNKGEIFHNSTTGGRGGIYNTGTVNFNGADVRMNTAAVGGAIYNLGTLNYQKGCLMGNKCAVTNAPQVVNLGKMTMKGSFVIEDDVIGLFPVTDENGNISYTNIEVTDKITTNVKINIAFYEAIPEDSVPEEMKYANKDGYYAFSGLKRYTETAAARSQIVNKGIGSYEILENGEINYVFPVMPLGAWIACVAGVAVITVGAVLIVKKKKANALNAETSNETK